MRWPVFGAGLVAVLAVGMSLFHLYSGAFGVFEALMQRLIHVAFAFGILFLQDLIPGGDEPETDTPSSAGSRARMVSRLLGTALCLIVTAVSLGYLFLNYDYVTGQRYPYISELSSVELAIGIAFTLVVIEAARRTMGWPIALLAIGFLVYPFISPYLPGILHNEAMSLEKVIDGLFFTTDGILGIAIGISATFVVLFIIFAAFLEITGFGDFMMNLAKGVAGTARGGPAKMAILASGLTGMITGSAVANVVATGSFTIPLMRRTGYSRNFAGAVEAAASTGSQFMPPVMGAQAFIMAQFTGTPYALIALYSLVPAVLYYVGLWVSLDLEARRLGLVGLSRDQLGPWQKTVLERAHLVLPLVLLIVLLVMGRTAMHAAVWSVVALVLVSLIRRQTRIGPRRIVEALRRGAEMSVPVVAATAVAGIIVLSVTITGLGDRMSQLMIDLAQGNLGVGLILAMLAALVLGMGLPTVPAYIVQVGLVVPALVQMGLSLVVAHLFVIYFSCLSMVTPPVALAAYAAAGISGGDAFRTGLQASKLAAVGFLVPFVFAFDPALILMGDDPFQSARSITTTFIGVVGLAIALQGYLYAPTPWWERLISLAGALLLVHAGLETDVAGGVLLALVFFRQRSVASRHARSQAHGDDRES